MSKTNLPPHQIRLPRLLHFRDSLQGSLLVAFVLLSIASIGAVAGASIYIGVRTSREVARDEMVADVELNQQAIRNWLNERLYNLDVLVHSPTDLQNARQLLARPTDAVTADALRQRFAFETSADGSFAEIFLIDISGRVSLSTTLANERINHQHQAHFREGQKGRYVSQVFFNSTTNEHQIIVSLPIPDSNGSTIGVLAGRLRVSDLSHFILSRGKFTETGQVYLVSSDRRFITNLRFAPASNLAQSEGIDRALDPQNHRNGNGLYTNYNDVRVVGAYRWLPDLRVALVAERDADEGIEEIWRLVGFIVGITILTLFAAVLASRMITIRITRPVFALTTAAQEIAEGNLKQAPIIETPHEIAVLSHALNIMIEQQQQSINTLEDRVGARTRDLKIAANVSRKITTELDLETLLPQLVEQTRLAFDLYHASVFLHDEESADLRLAATTNSLLQANANQVPNTLAEQVHLEHSAIVITNTENNAHHVLHPLFPATRSQVVLPMIVGDKFVGVLDLQATDADHFDAEEIDVLRSLADQIAVAVRNAELYTTAKTAREEAERANRVKSQFLAAMSHELRTPLNGILNFTHFIATELLGPVNDSQKETLHKVLDSGQHLLSLINDVLDISKIEAGALELFPDDNVNLDGILDGISGVARGLLANKPVKFEMEIEAGLPTILADQRRVRQIILNIVSNACKFTAEGVISLNAYAQGKEIIIRIQDSGPGIAPEEYEAVFDSFKQTKSGIDHGGGTGLGMPISKRLAEAHGGRMWLESEVGQGATFYVALPIRSEILVKKMKKLEGSQV